VSIDYCPKCHGVWLECGNLDQIIDRAHDEEGAGHYPTDHRSEYDRIAYADRVRSLHVSMYDITA